MVDALTSGDRDGAGDADFPAVTELHVGVVTSDTGQGDSGKVYRPRRVVQAAQEFGESGMVQSIYQKDLRPAIDAIVGVIAKRLRARCE
jgi:hypothetical protein